MGWTSRIKAELASALGEFADALWPPRCRLCGRHAEDGLACIEHALPQAPPGERCGRCLAPLPRGVADGARCADCRRHPPGWTRLVALGDYRAQPALREWVLAFKHGGRPDLARPLGSVLGRSALRAGVCTDPGAVLVPVPLHPRRRLERGYDQAARLAAELECATGLPLVCALRRRRDTPPQGAPGARSRSANVSGVFGARSNSARRVRAHPVWLVDDVVTSGATASECARVLRSLGAARVGVLALARAAPGRLGESELG